MKPKQFEIKVTGSGTIDDIIEKLEDLKKSLVDHVEGDNQYEDSILYTEISEKE